MLKTTNNFILKRDKWAKERRQVTLADGDARNRICESYDPTFDTSLFCFNKLLYSEPGQLKL